VAAAEKGMNAMTSRSIAAAGLALVALTTLAAPAWAQAPAELGEDAKALASGTWELSNADRDKRCTVTFRTDRAAAGMRLEFDRGCAGQFPFITEIVGWTRGENDFLRMLDAKGKSVLEFSEVESRIFEAPRPGEGILFIQASTAVGPPPKEPEEMIGDWAIRRSAGKTICTLTLAKTPAGDDLALKVKPGCDQFVARFAPTAWQMDRGELLLKNAKGQTWRFAEGDASIWQRIPETTDPVLLARP
jgi:hypothetical protein